MELKGKKTHTHTQGEETAGGEGGGGRVGDPEGGEALRLREDRLRVRHHRPEGDAEEAEEDEEGGAQEERG